MSCVGIVLLSVVLCCSCYVGALECGIKEGLQQEEVQNAVTKCMIEKNFKSSNDTSDEDVTITKIDNEPLHLANRANVDISSKNKREVARDSHETQHTDSPSPMSQQCILQCVFAEISMVDENGFPEHNKVAQGLIKNARNRELRDFLQDSTDECFQLLEQGDKADSCDYSSNLVTCLAEKGRSNCADWQFANLTMQN